MNSNSSKGALPPKAHLIIAVVSFVAAIFLLSGQTGYDIPAGATALGIIIGGNSLGHLFATYNQRELKFLDRITGTIALYGVSVLIAHYLLG
ncbi:MAG: hypothetical protein R3194_11135 [Limnobacter sp.]|nr:hypothetical protein [Limnobacter sp.]